MTFYTFFNSTSNVEFPWPNCGSIAYISNVIRSMECNPTAMLALSSRVLYGGYICLHLKKHFS